MSSESLGMEFARAWWVARQGYPHLPLAPLGTQVRALPPNLDMAVWRRFAADYGGEGPEVDNLSGCIMARGFEFRARSPGRMWDSVIVAVSLTTEHPELLACATSILALGHVEVSPVSEEGSS